MFFLLRITIWLAGILAIGYILLGYFGYEVNTHYFDASKTKCQELLQQCQKNIIHQGLDNVKCDYQCVDPTLIIKKK